MLLSEHDVAIEAHRRAFQTVAQPGAWWTAAERVAMVHEARRAVGCRRCQHRRDLISLSMDHESHEAVGPLPAPAVEAIHAIRNDSGRLTRRWFERVSAEGLRPEAYVELVAVVATSVIVDTYAKGIGARWFDLPEPKQGSPTYESDATAVEAGAWVPIASIERANILRSLGLVPSASDLFFAAFHESYYMPTANLQLRRPQVELVASRVSSVNQCFY